MSLIKSFDSLARVEYSSQEMIEKIEILRRQHILNDQKMTRDSFLILFSELQPLYSKLIIVDLENAAQRQLENYLWNDCFKVPLSRVALSNDKKLFNLIVETGVGYYLAFIQDIGIHFDIPFIKNSIRGLHSLDAPGKPIMKQIVKYNPSKTIVYYIIQNSLIHVGDLLRYGGSYSEAKKMYDKSTALCPSNGHPYHQLAHIQIMTDDKTVESMFTAIYYYIRALCSSKPYTCAMQQLEITLIAARNLQPRNEVETYLLAFLIGLGKLPTNDLTVGLSKLIKVNGIDSPHLLKLLVIGIWTWKRKENNGALEIISSLINGVIVAGTECDSREGIWLCAGFLSIAFQWMKLNDLITIEFLEGLNGNALLEFTTFAQPLEQSLDELDHVILQEEKRLLGFLPMTKAFEHLSSVIEDTDPRANTLRINRFMRGIRLIEEMEPSFLKTTTEELEPLPFIFPMRPSFRNVAMQSIWRHLSTAYDPEENNNASTPKSTPAPIKKPTISPVEYYPYPIGTRPLEWVSTASEPIERFDTTDFSKVFHSIWTPLQTDDADWD